jgi:glycosyltransferase involved in cell wall biosynthesis
MTGRPSNSGSLLGSSFRDRNASSQKTWPDDVQADIGTASKEEAAPRVSIVLPIYNSAKEVPAILTELSRQSFADREIILVDDGSTDETWSSAKALSTGQTNVFFLRTDHRGPAHARNVGLQHSRGEIIFFSETDCVYDPEYLQKAVYALDSHADASAVCLTGAPLVTRRTLATLCIEIENKVQHRLLSQGRIEPFYAWVYRRKVLLDLGGFDDRLFQGEDRDLFRRLKNARYGVALVPGVNWQHVRDQTMAELAGKWFGRGRTRLLYLIKHRRILDIIKSLAPFWATFLGLALLVLSPLLGGLILLVVVAAFLARTVRVMTVSWPLVQRKRTFFGYPLFIAVRNFTTAMGYSLALVTISARRLQGKELTWESLAPDHQSADLDI